MPAERPEITPATMQDLLAAEIAAEAAHYLLTMYPTGQAARHPAMLRSLRAVIACDVRAAMRLGGDAEAREWLDCRSRHRREINRVRKLGDQGEVVRGDPAACDALIAQLRAPQEIDHAD